ncbi:MAG: PfkB family carbohydrate kinase [Treponemataceae bacterium]|nr:MAG: PfkB family carbohydrate kinase [Treponemataceae bacterium]
MAKKFDTAIIGQPSLDINTDHTGSTIREIGGAVVYSGYAASALGHPVCVLPMLNAQTISAEDVFKDAENAEIIPIPSARSTSIENIYHTADKERRTCRAISMIDGYKPGMIPDVDAEIFHLAGLMRGDIGDDMIRFVAAKALVALDVQCLLRCADGKTGEMMFHDWPAKKELLPLISFLKTDAAEAEIMTGYTDRVKAAKLLHSWGAKEVMITHNTEVIVYDGSRVYAEPLKPRNLSGRSGRGDTAFSAYICERLTRDIPDALLTAAALVSLKMEKPGPFKGTRKDVEAYCKEFYRQQTNER